MSDEDFPDGFEDGDNADFDFDAAGEDYDFEGDFKYENSESDEEEVEDLEVQISNCYYTSKGLIENEPSEALGGFKQILDMEPSKGEWGFKALKQIVKIYFNLKDFTKMMESYKQLLTYIKSSVTRNLSENVITSLIDYVSATDHCILPEFYQTTLTALLEAKNDRFWFKTNLKVGKLRFEREEFDELEKILRDLLQSCKNPDGSDDLKKGTQLLEIYALEIQMYTAQKNNKKLRELYDKSLKVQSAIPHPRIMAVIRECGGKMNMIEESWKEAQKDFFEAFKNYDEAGSSRRIQCLKYMVLANLLSLSEINPFAAPETASYKTDPQVVAMTDLVSAYEQHDIHSFERILQNNRDTIMDDKFISMYIQDLLKNIRTQVLTNLLRPYTRVTIAFISQELNIPDNEVEQLLVNLILDKKIKGKIDQVNRLLVVDRPGVGDGVARYDALDEWSKQLAALNRTVVAKLQA